MNLDIGKSFTFVGEDPDWIKKLAIGGALGLATIIAIVTIVGWIPLALIVIGYQVQLTRNVIAGNPRPLPEWDNWGERMLDGLKGWFVGFVFALPATILSLAFSAPYYASIVTDIVAGNSSGTPSSTSTALSGLSTVGGCLAWIVGLICGLFVPIAIGRYAATNDLGQAFQLGPIFATLRQHFVTYFVIALIANIVVGLISVLGLVAFCIGIFFTSFYAQVVLYHLYGQAYREAAGLNYAPGYGQPYGPRPF
jgi:hypothetical protein